MSAEAAPDERCRSAAMTVPLLMRMVLVPVPAAEILWLMADPLRVSLSSTVPAARP
jgi:hypothetical protein